LRSVFCPGGAPPKDIEGWPSAAGACTLAREVHARPRQRPPKQAAALARRIHVMPFRRVRSSRAEPMLRKILALLAITTLVLPLSAAAQEAPPAERESAQETVEQFRPVVAVVENSRNLATTPETIGELIDLEGRIRSVVEK